MGHALEGGFLDLADLVLMDSQLLQALGHVGWHVLEHVFGQVESLQFGQWRESLRVDYRDLVVHQDQSLKGKKRLTNASSICLMACLERIHINLFGMFWFEFT